MPKTNEELIAAGRAITRARKVKERAEKKRAHNKKMLEAVRSGNKDELKRLMAINPLRGPTKRQLRGGRPARDLFFGKSVSRTYVSDIALDAGDFFFGVEYNEGFHRGQV